MDSREKALAYTRRWKRAKRQCRPTKEQPNPSTPSTLNTDDIYVSDDTSSLESDTSSLENFPLDPEGEITDSQEDSMSEQNAQHDETLQKFLKGWAIQHNTPQNTIDDLLVGLRRHGLPDLPRTCRTLLGTARSVAVEMKSGMQYVHFDFREAMVKHLKCYSDSSDEESVHNISTALSPIPSVH
ncbi:hypothetical protein AAFF_G00174570, partial [Aldrovandia affinis]